MLHIYKDTEHIYVVMQRLVLLVSEGTESCGGPTNPVRKWGTDPQVLDFGFNSVAASIATAKMRVNLSGASWYSSRRDSVWWEASGDTRFAYVVRVLFVFGMNGYRSQVTAAVGQCSGHTLHSQQSTSEHFDRT